MASKRKPRRGESSALAMERGAEACETMCENYTNGSLNITEAKYKAYKSSASVLRKDAALAQHRAGCEVSFNQPEQAWKIAKQRQEKLERDKAQKAQKIQNDLFKYPPLGN